MLKGYRDWLVERGYSPNTINTQVSHALRLEQAYGDLDELYGTDRLEAILSSLLYSSEDGRRGRPNPSRLPIGGELYKALASFRSAVGLYRRYRDEAGAGGSPVTAVIPTAAAPAWRGPTPDENGTRIGLERDLQQALRRGIAGLEPGLVIIDEGVERSVASGFIDITARDAGGALVVIELKAGIADRSAVGQILSYMGDLAEEEASPVRGILVAHGFDAKARAAARVVPTLSLRSYAVRFTFADASGRDTQA